MSVAERRAELRETLIAAAEARIARDGLAGLRARDLAADAGCAVGTIYTLFDDLSALVLAVNARTFQAIGQTVTAAVAAEPDPARQLIVMGHAYARFAAENPAQWQAVFDVALKTGAEAPAWYAEAVSGLFDIIAAPLTQLRTDLGPGEIRLLSRALFAAVHGMVRLSQEDRISAVPTPAIPEAIELLIGSAVRAPKASVDRKPS